MAKATLINSSGQKQVVEVGSADANKFLGQGYQLMGASGKFVAPGGGNNQAPGSGNVGQGSSSKATLINNKGDKVVVDSGSQQAKDYFGQGYQLMTDLNKDINANQQNDIAKKEAEMNGAPGKSKAELAMDELRKTVTPDTPKPTEQPKLEQTYNDLRASYGVTDLETQLNDLKNSEEKLRSDATARKDYAESKPVALGVIAGRQSEIDRQTDKQLTENLRQQNYLTNQLKTKYDIIGNIMNFRQKDYENAQSAYDKEFSQNIQLLQQVRADETANTNQDNIKADNARADYAIFINAIKDGSLDISSLSSSQKAILTKLEVQQGLPVGTYEMLVPKTQGKSLTSLGVDNNSSGGRSAYFMTVDKKTGQPSIISIPLPGAVSTKSSGGGSGKQTQEEKDIEKFRNDAADLIGKLDGGEMSWGTAWQQLHVKYPNASNELIDQTLGGGYDSAKKEWWGRGTIVKKRSV